MKNYNTLELLDEELLEIQQHKDELEYKLEVMKNVMLAELEIMESIAETLKYLDEASDEIISDIMELEAELAEEDEADGDVTIYFCENCCQFHRA